MFGDRPFFGESIFNTPSQPQPATPQPNYGGHYVSGPNQSGFHHSDGSFTGYQSGSYGEPIKFYDRSNHVHP